MKQIYLIVIAALLGSINMYADDEFQETFSPVFAQSTHSSKLGRYKGQKVKGKLNGMGVINLKAGGVYYGDVNDGQPEGYGVIICPDGIKEYPDAGIYAGRFKKGKIEGNGICYTSYGIPLFKGKFVNGVAEQRSAVSNNSEFVILDVAENCQYVGEIQNQQPNGLGAIVFGNGDVILSNFIDGHRDGLGVTIARNGEWQTENVVNGKAQVLSTSEYYHQLNQQHKAIFSNMLADISGAVSKASADILAKSKNVVPVASDDDDVLSEMDDENNGTTRSKQYYQDLYDKYAKRAEKCLDEGTKEDAKNAATLIKQAREGGASYAYIQYAKNMHRFHKKQYNLWSSSMIKIYKRAKKKGYNLKKSLCHGYDYPKTLPAEIVNKVLKNTN